MEWNRHYFCYKKLFFPFLSICSATYAESVFLELLTTYVVRGKLIVFTYVCFSVHRSHPVQVLSRVGQEVRE